MMTQGCAGPELLNDFICETSNIFMWPTSLLHNQKSVKYIKQTVHVKMLYKI